MIGLGMAAAIFVDALIVRTVLAVPAIMHTLANGTGTMPSWLDRRLPHLEIEEGSAIRPEEHEPALARSA